MTTEILPFLVKFPVGNDLASLREKAGLTQNELAKHLTVSPARISRTETGDVSLTAEELGRYLDTLTALGVQEAADFKEFISQEWLRSERPSFDHPDRALLWELETTLHQAMKDDPELKNIFLRQLELYEDKLTELGTCIPIEVTRYSFQWCHCSWKVDCTEYAVQLADRE